MAFSVKYPKLVYGSIEVDLNSAAYKIGIKTSPAKATPEWRKFRESDGTIRDELAGHWLEWVIELFGCVTSELWTGTFSKLDGRTVDFYEHEDDSEPYECTIDVGKPYRAGKMHDSLTLKVKTIQPFNSRTEFYPD